MILPRKLFSIPVMLLMITALIGCAPAPIPAANGKLRIVATFSILGDIVQNIGGDAIALDVLVPADSDAHTFDARPQDAAKIAQAQVIFANGLSFEPWLNDLYLASKSSGKLVEVASVLPESDLLHGEENHSAETEAHAEGLDPHIWHSVPLVQKIAGEVANRLAELDPANAEKYQANANAYQQKLAELDSWIRTEVEQIPVERRQLITSHDTFSYFAKEYGFAVPQSVLAGLSTNTTEPSAGEVAKIIQDIKASGVPAIFAENIRNPQLITQIANEAGVKLAPALFTDALGKSADGTTYLEMMHYNVNTIVENLK